MILGILLRMRKYQLPETQCTCGAMLSIVALPEEFHAPCPGDYIACPSCLSIYRLDSELHCVSIPQKKLPQDVLEERDSILDLSSNARC